MKEWRKIPEGHSNSKIENKLTRPKKRQKTNIQIILNMTQYSKSNPTKKQG